MDFVFTEKLISSSFWGIFEWKIFLLKYLHYLWKQIATWEFPADDGTDNCL